jgi:S-adenosylmethionine hydrolase
LDIVPAMHTLRWVLASACLLIPLVSAAEPQPGTLPGLVVLQTDFGLKDQAVAAMRGVIRGVDRGLVIDDLTHEIPAFNVWEAAYRLRAVIDYWPSGTVFVSVVDPGVGTTRRSVVARLNSGHYVVTPDNGTLTLLADSPGIDAVRAIDEDGQRLPGSERSYTFHGRDLYAYVGARLASGQLEFSELSSAREAIVEIAYQRATRDGNVLNGTVDVLDPQYGNVWTNIGVDLLDALAVGEGQVLAVRIRVAGAVRFDAEVPFHHTFGAVPLGAPLVYVNSIGKLALALNQDSFAARYGVVAGPDTQVRIIRAGSAD